MDSMGSLSFYDRRQLLGWISDSDRKEVILLYSFTRDGASAATFHDKCDNKGPTFTVVYNTPKSVFGGYTSKSWDKSNAYKCDDTAFMYSLSLDSQRTFIKFPVKKSQYAIYCGDSYGPTFGAGHDMYLFQGTLTAENNIFTLNGGFNHGHSYDMLSKKPEDVTNGTKTVTNIEVYGIQERGISMWRKTPMINEEVLKNLQKEVESFQPLSSQVEKANILLLGPRGAGKSSFVNNVDSVFKGRMSYRASSAGADVSTTIKYQAYSFVIGPEGKMAKFQFFDTRGLEETTTLSREDISLILDGYVSNGYIFEPGVAIKIGKNAEATPKLNDRIHCVCFVIDGSTVLDISDTALTKIKETQSAIRQKGVPLLILVTKMDKIMHGFEQDLDMLFSSPVVKLLVDQIAETFGAQHNHIFPMKNYESEIDVLEHINAMTLINVRQMLIAAEDFISNQTILEV